LIEERFGVQTGVARAYTRKRQDCLRRLLAVEQAYAASELGFIISLGFRKLRDQLLIGAGRFAVLFCVKEGCGPRPHFFERAGVIFDGSA
jgi:hypothetical protein